MNDRQKLPPPSRPPCIVQNLGIAAALMGAGHRLMGIQRTAEGSSVFMFDGAAAADAAGYRTGGLHGDIRRALVAFDDLRDAVHGRRTFEEIRQPDVPVGDLGTGRDR